MGTTCGSCGLIPGSRCARSSTLRRAAATVRPISRPSQSLAEALTAVAADFACIATPPGALPELTHEALAAGLAVLVEKPMAVDEHDALEMVADAQRRGLLLAVGLVERCNPAVQALQLLLDEDTAGAALTSTPAG